jgi:hypothetical protein
MKCARHLTAADAEKSQSKRRDSIAFNPLRVLCENSAPLR